MRVLWSSTLFLGLLSCCTCYEEGCVVGVVGEPVSLPCFYSGYALTTFNFSVEWRTDGRLLLRSVWEQAERVELWQSQTAGVDPTRLSDDALENGDFSLELSAVLPLRHPETFHMFLIVVGDEASRPPLCTVCLRTEASFTPPLVRRLDPPEANQTTFLCHSVGGRPEPRVHWLINGTRAPDQGNVSSSALPVANTTLYNITSLLVADVSHQTTVTCSVENPWLNETLNATSYGVKVSPVASRASEGLWVFTTGLCLGVGVLVVAAIIYQVLLDRRQKETGKIPRGYKFNYNYSSSPKQVRVHLEQTDRSDSPNETDG